MWGGLNKTQMAGSMVSTVEATALPVRMYWKIRRGHETERDCHQMLLMCGCYWSQKTSKNSSVCKWIHWHHPADASTAR